MNKAVPDALRCCVCYSYNCYESVDHFPYSFPQLNELIDKAKTNKLVIDALKTSIK